MAKKSKEKEIVGRTWVDIIVKYKFISLALFIVVLIITIILILRGYTIKTTQFDIQAPYENVKTPKHDKNGDGIIVDENTDNKDIGVNGNKRKTPIQSNSFEEKNNKMISIVIKAIPNSYILNIALENQIKPQMVLHNCQDSKVCFTITNYTSTNRPLKILQISIITQCKDGGSRQSFKPYEDIINLGSVTIKKSNGETQIFGDNKTIIIENNTSLTFSFNYDFFDILNDCILERLIVKYIDPYTGGENQFVEYIE